jgi:hypothetical protein
MTLTQQIADTNKISEQTKKVLDAIKTEMNKREDDIVMLPKSSIIDLCDLLTNVTESNIKHCNKISEIVNILYGSSISTMDLNKILDILEK